MGPNYDAVGGHVEVSVEVLDERTYDVVQQVVTRYRRTQEAQARRREEVSSPLSYSGPGGMRR